MKWLAGLALVLLVLLALVWFAGPPLVKSQGEAALTQALGRPVTFGHVTVQPFALKLTVDEITVGGIAGGAPLLEVGRVAANVSAGSLFRFAPVIEALEVIRPRLRMTHEAAGRYDIDDLIGRFSAAPERAPPAEPSRFALYNVQVVDGEVSFDDRPAGRTHRVTGLQLSLPFLSNLDADVAVKVEPRLAFTLNGAVFDTGAQATPFASTRSGTLDLAIDRFDITPYLPYVPSVWPVRLERGLINGALHATFAAGSPGAPALAVKGELRVSDLSLSTPEGRRLLSWDTMSLGLADVQPFARKLALSHLTFDGLVLHGRRGKDGQLDGWSPSPAASAKPVATPPGPASAASGIPKSSAPGWQVTIGTLALDRSRLDWTDATVAPAAAITLADVSVKADRLVYPGLTALPFSAAAVLQSTGERPRPWGKVSATGSAGAEQARIALALDAVALDAVQPYLAAVLEPRASGSVSATGELLWSNDSKVPQLQLTLAQATLDDLKLKQDAVVAASGADEEVLSVKQARVAGVAVDLVAHRVAVDTVQFRQPSLLLAREGTAPWNVSRWSAVSDRTVPNAGLGSAASPEAVRPARPPASSPLKPQRDVAGAPVSAEAAPWKVSLKSVGIEGGQVRLSDASAMPGKGNEPVRATFAGIALDVRDFVWDGERAVPASKLKLSGRVGNGHFAFDGQAGLAPQMVSGSLSVSRFPVQAFAPYVTLSPGVTLARAEAGFKGRVAVRMPPSGPEASVEGDVLLADVLLQSRGTADAGPGDDLVQWQALALTRLRLDAIPGAKPRLNIAEAALNDLRARLVVTEVGRLNLQDAAGGRVGPQVAAVAPPSPDASSPTASSPADGTTARAGPSEAIAAAATPRGKSDALPLEVSVGQTRITNGRIEFTDNFVRPKYSADLTQLDGRLGAISTTTSAMADLALKGRVAGTAALEISGQVQPLASPPVLDITARASDLELAPLSPYAAKYVGYAIERGKLTMDVAYRIDVDGRLEARNQVILNQLTFGEAVASPQATTLPVRLAVSLLKDRRGVIDINLPVSGSLNDPEFSIGGLIFKVLGNLIARAVTSPFSLLAGSGGNDSSELAFVPGSSRLTREGLAAIDGVANALKEKPSLKLTITGTSDADAERDAYQRLALDARLQAERRKEGLATASAGDDPVPLSDQDRVRLLTLLYRQAALPDKPRNALGLPKDLPAVEMEARLKRLTVVDNDVMRELALQRAVVARDALAARGLPAERLFLAAPKGRGEEPGWTPSVKMGLSLD